MLGTLKICKNGANILVDLAHHFSSVAVGGAGWALSELGHGNKRPGSRPGRHAEKEDLLA